MDLGSGDGDGASASEVEGEEPPMERVQLV
jgi:hypothetical protein